LIHAYDKTTAMTHRVMTNGIARERVDQSPVKVRSVLKGVNADNPTTARKKSSMGTVGTFTSMHLR
jgi:hypothetical protein